MKQKIYDQAKESHHIGVISSNGVCRPDRYTREQMDRQLILETQGVQGFNKLYPARTDAKIEASMKSTREDLYKGREHLLGTRATSQMAEVVDIQNLVPTKELPETAAAGEHRQETA